MDKLFEDRADAGRQLGARLAGMGLDDPVVLALPRGGVPVAAEVARALKAPLDLVLVRKIGAPMQPELAVAAVADGAEPALEIDESTLEATGTSSEYVRQQLLAHLQEIERRRTAYLQGCLPLDIKGRTAVLVDDGIATGTTVRAAIHALRRREPRRIVLAVPVAPREELPVLASLVDQLVCLSSPAFFHAVGAHYRHFGQTSDEEVIEVMKEFRGAVRREDERSGPA